MKQNIETYTFVSAYDTVEELYSWLSLWSKEERESIFIEGTNQDGIVVRYYEETLTDGSLVKSLEFDGQG